MNFINCLDKHSWLVGEPFLGGDSEVFRFCSALHEDEEESCANSLMPEKEMMDMSILRNSYSLLS